MIRPTVLKNGLDMAHHLQELQVLDSNYDAVYKDYEALCWLMTSEERVELVNQLLQEINLEHH